MTLGERPPLSVCLEASEPHIRMLLGTQLVTPSFYQPTPEDGKFFTFARDTRLGLLPATVLAKPEWTTLGEVNVPQE